MTALETPDVSLNSTAPVISLQRTGARGGNMTGRAGKTRFGLLTGHVPHSDRDQSIPRIFMHSLSHWLGLMCMMSAITAQNDRILEPAWY